MRRPHWRRWAGMLLVGALLGALVTPTAGNAAAGPNTAVAGKPSITDTELCFTDFTCGYLTVPLDRAGRVPGTLRLRVAMANNVTAPRGTLLFLTGGPGQPGAGLVPSISNRVDYLLDDYRLVMIDQRGTGEDAIDCPRLQVEAGASDITPPTAQAVRECAKLLGKTRHFYTTADTVADLEDLRRALGTPRWTIDGISYGAFVGIQYGLTHPVRVNRLVLDSVVPQGGMHSLYVDSLHRTGFVLRQACQEQSCSFDPEAALADVARLHDNGVGIFDLMVVASILDPKLTGDTFFPMLELLHQASLGNVDPLNDAIDFLRTVGIQVPPEEFSSGLHVATLCADLTDLPWGNSTAPLAGRDQAIASAVAGLKPSQTFPFPPETAVGHALIHSCRFWPPSRHNPQPKRPRLTMPVLLINGDRDLSTPLEWAQEQAAQTPRGTLVVIPGMGHSIQGRNAEGDAVVAEFLLGKPKGRR